MVITQEIMADFATFFYFPDFQLAPFFFVLNIPFSERKYRRMKKQETGSKQCLSERFKTFGAT